MPFASPSSPDFWISKNGLWPEENPFAIPFIGNPHRTFEFHDKQGRLQAWLGEWDTTWGQPIQFWSTLWAKDSDPPRQEWAFLRPNLPLCPYGLDLALKYPEATLVIDDDVSVVKTGNEKLTSTHSSPPVVLLGVTRHALGMSAFDWDFSPLAGRRVFCLGQNDLKSITHTVDLHKALSDSGVYDIGFVLPRPDRNGETRVHLLHETGGMWERQLDIKEFRDLAEQDYGIAPEKPKNTHNEVWRLGKDELPTVSDEDFILAPILPAGSIVLLYAPAGVGKTFFALLLSCAIAGGIAILDGRFRAPRKQRVLYVCSEMAASVARRITEIMESLGLSKDERDLNVWPSPDCQEPTINLESPEAWSRLAPYIDQCDFLVLDHLTGLTGGRNDQSSWSKLWPHLKKIRAQGKTILIVHHSGKNGEMRGVSNIRDDVDSVIAMAADDHFTNCARLTWEKHRDDINHGEALQPFDVLWSKCRKTGKMRWWPPTKTRSMIDALEAHDILTIVGQGKATHYKLTDVFAQKLT